jgi:hypothetical protein
MLIPNGSWLKKLASVSTRLLRMRSASNTVGPCTLIVSGM